MADKDETKTAPKQEMTKEEKNQKTLKESNKKNKVTFSRGRYRSTKTSKK